MDTFLRLSFLLGFFKAYTMCFWLCTFFSSLVWFGWSRLNADDCYIINTFGPIQWRDNFIQWDSMLLWRGLMLFQCCFQTIAHWIPKNNAQICFFEIVFCPIAKFLVHFYLLTLFSISKRNQSWFAIYLKEKNCQTEHFLDSYNTEGGIFCWAKQWIKQIIRTVKLFWVEWIEEAVCFFFIDFYRCNYSCRYKRQLVEILKIRLKNAAVDTKAQSVNHIRFCLIHTIPLHHICWHYSLVNILFFG